LGKASRQYGGNPRVFGRLSDRATGRPNNSATQPPPTPPRRCSVVSWPWPYPSAGATEPNLRLELFGRRGGADGGGGSIVPLDRRRIRLLPARGIFVHGSGSTSVQLLSNSATELPRDRNRVQEHPRQKAVPLKIGSQIVRSNRARRGAAAWPRSTYATSAQ
jgi:hypothetical protein